MKKLHASLSISSHTDNRGHRTFTIRLMDNMSRNVMVDVEISGTDFADALATLSDRPCVAEFNDSGLIGMKRETKREYVPCDRLGHQEDTQPYLTPFEIDGWKAYKADLGNHHNRTKNGYSVSFHRHVPATPEELEAAKKDY